VDLAIEYAKSDHPTSEMDNPIVQAENELVAFNREHHTVRPPTTLLKFFTDFLRQMQAGLSATEIQSQMDHARSQDRERREKIRRAFHISTLLCSSAILQFSLEQIRLSHTTIVDIFIGYQPLTGVHNIVKSALLSGTRIFASTLIFFSDSGSRDPMHYRRAFVSAIVGKRCQLGR
jgi:hypothetical protein